MWQKSPWTEALSGYCVKLDCAGDSLVLEVPEPWDICKKSYTQGVESKTVMSAKPEGQSHRRPLTADLELQALECTLLGFSLSLVQHFLFMS